ncbi:MAG: hypothetical protein PUK21_05565 [Peptostreptococcaceae bacterium]|nr:hypothetical protein [Peptostreptococcaceae bacterium]MDY5738594.1 hypothetical protein [Anaerovoracaceae bacterium]
MIKMRFNLLDEKYGMVIVNNSWYNIGITSLQYFLKGSFNLIRCSMLCVAINPKTVCRKQCSRAGCYYD